MENVPIQKSITRFGSELRDKNGTVTIFIFITLSFIKFTKAVTKNICHYKNSLLNLHNKCYWQIMITTDAVITVVNVNKRCICDTNKSVSLQLHNCILSYCMERCSFFTALIIWNELLPTNASSVRDRPQGQIVWTYKRASW